jgi:multisubunit Na+/H+ antiporter MnhB subunit
MNTAKIAAIVLITAGFLGLVYLSFKDTNEKHRTGTMALSAKAKESLNVSVWTGVGAIMMGGALFIFASKKN